jgi:WD40 repeat protein
MAVDRVAWNPVNGHLVGLYKDGSIFKWDPIRNDGHEVRTMADEIEVSPDGKLFVTSDSNGTVKVWSFAYFSIVYQLSSENLVTGLTFSPDCRRFYDLRGSSVNVWEPNSLVRLSENEESLSDTASDDQTLASISQASEAWIVPIDPIYVLAAPQRGSMYCVGSENGLVDLFDTSGGKLLELMKFSTFLTVNHLAWSEDGKIVVASDLGGNIVVKYLNIAPPSNDNRVINVQPVHSVKIKVDIGGIHQVLLNRDSTKLLVLAQEISQVWSVENGCVHTASVLERVRIRRWTNHPTQTKFFIGVGPIDLKIFCWSDLSEAGCVSLWGDWPRLHDRSHLDAEECDEVTLAPWSPYQSHVPHEDTIVSKLMHTQDGQHLLVQVSEVSTKVKSTKGIIILPRSSLEQPHDNGPRTTLRSLPIPSTILNRIEVPLGVLPGSRLVFLDKDLWMCTIRLEAVDFTEGLKRHFFVPRDWASTEALDQCCILEDGTFLLPKDGEVAIIASALGAPGW